MGWNPPLLTCSSRQEEPLGVDITPTGGLMDDVAGGADPSTLLQALVDAGPRSVLHVAQGTDDLHVLRVVIHIHLRIETNKQTKKNTNQTLHMHT